VQAPPGDGRLYTRWTNRGSNAEREEIYTYTDAGLLGGVQLATNGTQWTRTYDSVGRIVTDTQPGSGITLRHSYQPNTEQLVLDAGSATATITRTYDPQERIAGVTFNGGSIATFDYSGGALGAIHYGNGITQSYSYDDRLRPLGTTVAKGATLASVATIFGGDDVPRARTRTLSAFTATDLFQADAITRVTAENLGLPGVPALGGTSTGNVRDLTNDDVQAVWSMASPNGAFVFDAASNWTARQGTKAFTPTVDGFNRFTAIDQDTVGYDALGNIASYRDESYTFSGEGMLTSATKAGVTTSYGNDGFRRRWYESSGGHNTYYVWDGDALLATVPDGDATRAQVRIGAGSDDTLALADAFGVNPLHYVHADTDGSAIAATDPYGVLVEGYAYSAYGDTSVLDTGGNPIAASRVGNRFLFQGQLYDPQLGMYSMRAREYRPAWGRFLSADPAGLMFSDNRYAFVGGRSLTWGDPSGLCGKDLYGLAEKAGWDWASTGVLEDYYRGKYGLTQNYALTMAGVRSTSAKANWHQRNYARAALDSALGLVDEVGSLTLGNSGGQTARKIGTGLVVGGAIGAFFKWAMATAPVWQPIAAGGGALGTSSVVGGTAAGDAAGAATAADAEVVAPAAAGDASAARAASGRVTTPVGELRSAGLKDAHHVIQDAAVRDRPGYNTNAAPGVQLQGPANVPGTPHNLTRPVQRQAGGGTYAAERRIGYKALRRAGMSPEDARQAVEEADGYFQSIGVGPSTPTRIPGDRR
jgi:RHS repeat-associated protein